MKIRDFQTRIGTELGTSRWFVVDQARINAFADVTEDHQGIHVDAEAAKASPFGTTIAHGFLSLSLLAPMMYDIWDSLGVEDLETSVNYGFDSLRFLSPVPAGSRLRAKVVLSDVKERPNAQYLMRYEVTLEAEGIERPVLVAVWLGLVMATA